MRVIYEISLEDMRALIAEKYAIDSSKIEFMGHGDLTFARVDMSATEVPVPKPEPIEDVYDNDEDVKEYTDDDLWEMMQTKTVSQIEADTGLPIAGLYKRTHAIRLERASSKK